jgi:hypothetical protein
MPSMTLTSPVEIVGVKNAADVRVNPARKEDIEALPAAGFEQLALLLMEMMQTLQPSQNADASNRQRVVVESLSGASTAITGTITTSIGSVRVEEAGGFGLRNITDAAELRRIDMDTAFNTQLSLLVFS